jgi:ribonuclease J
MSQLLKITPFGGVGEIGSNMTVFEKDGEYLIIDYGILFPNEDFFDLKYLIPNIQDIPRDAKVTLVFSHGHEDHIGGFIHIINYFENIIVWASNFTAALLRKKMEESSEFIRINTFSLDSRIKFKDFYIDPIHVNHSIPETHGLCFTSNDIGIFFCSDFKIDHQSPYEEPIDSGKINRLMGDKKLRLGMIDSTNILVEGKTRSEGELVNDIEELVAGNKRLFVTLFSSNIHRIQTLINAAQKHKRKIALVGRSVRTYINVATDTNVLDKKNVQIYTPDQVDDFNKFEGIIILTGSQGDYFGALRRLADNEIREINLHEGDTVAFLSKTIPGNEKKIYKIYNKLTAQGANIVTARDKLIHASGHPGQEDLVWLNNNVSFTHYIPIHGETLFLKRHQEFIQQQISKNKHHPCGKLLLYLNRQQT